MKSIFFIILSLSLFSCQHKSEFDLNRDLYQFSEKMENGDTMKVKTELSACTFFAFEVYIFIKQNDSLFLEKYSQIDTGGKRTQTLPKIIYKMKANDPLSFENYLKYLNKEDKPDHKSNFPLVSVHYKNQKRNFYDDGLRDKFIKLDRLLLVKENMYPTDTFFMQEAPPPPPGK
ncbi:hypothetical protein MP477_19190 [Chryseobacterium sp. WG23]|uniref:hypothetical protein n=1 Tax=Chryseobacterium sp. WG23 TaxID=2926910 RepID=UPI00211F0ABB|nr:hypothetical protein [Chryseobacterium sp. WG23]MCQ9637075.1 hypothetical protein [Chryseobacterium sp. WG23]